MIAATVVLISILSPGFVRADEPTRVAIRSNDLSNAAPWKAFNRDKSLPAESVRNSEGFAKIDVAKAASHPALQLLASLATRLVEQNFLAPGESGEPQTLDGFGLRLSEIESIELATAVKLQSVISAEPSDGKNQLALSASGSSFCITTPEPVDWPALLLAMRPEAIEAVGIEGEWGAAFAKQLVKTDRLVMSQNDDSTPAPSSPNPKLNRLWEKTAGGVFTMVTTLTDKHIADHQELDSVNSQRAEMLRLIHAIEGVGIGMDVQPGSPAITFRVVMSGMLGTAEESAVEVAERLRDEAILAIEASDESPAALKPILQSCQFQLEKDPIDGEYLTIIGRFDPLMFLVL
jgi:hypothetical protein